jgi:hypothetical protein
MVRFLREDVKCAKKVHELLFHVQIVKQIIYFFTPEKEIAPLVKWSLRLPYTFLNFNEKEIFSLPLLQIIKIIPKQIHIQLKKIKKNK